MGVIWLLSSGARTPGPPLAHPLDWVAHFLGYLTLSFCLGKATGQAQLAWVLAAWFGALDEVHQAFVPPREAGVTDWVFDLLGAYLGSRLAVQRPVMPNIELDFTAEPTVLPVPNETSQMPFHEKGIAS